jgi:hypothetical protein
MAEDWIGPDWLGGSAIERIVDAPPKKACALPAISTPFSIHPAGIGAILGPIWPKFEKLDLFEKNQESSEGPANPPPP